MRVRHFLILWLGGTLGVLAYAGLDLMLYPHLQAEASMSMTPDLERLPDLAHWGGRLLHHGMSPLLVANAILIGGALALLGSSIAGLLRKKQEVERVGVFDEPSPTLRNGQPSEAEPGRQL